MSSFTRAGSFIATAIVIAWGGSVVAATLPAYPGVSSDDGLFGQQHGYDVLLRGNGEAVVTARLTMTNTGDSPLKEAVYEAVGATIDTITAYQRVDCTKLSLGTTQPATDVAQTPSGRTTTATQPTVVLHADTPLIECYPTYRPVDDTTGTAAPTATAQKTAPAAVRHYPTGMVYKKVAITQQGASISLMLPSEVKSQQSTTIIMGYNLRGVTHKQAGVYNYDFKTLKSDQRVTQTSVAVTVDDGYELAGARSGINYQEAVTPSLAELKAGTNLTGSASSVASSYVGSIGRTGGIVKQASQLEAGETFSVKGRYATSTFLLNWQRNAALVLALLAICAALIVLSRRRRATRTAATNTDQPKTAPLLSQTDRPVSEGIVNWQAVPLSGYVSRGVAYIRERRLRPIFFAWICAGLTGLLVYASLIASQHAASSMAYYYDGWEYVMLNASIIIAAILGTLLFCIGLPFLYADRMKTALKIIAHIVGFFIVAAALLFGLSYLENRDSDNGRGVPTYDIMSGTGDPL